MKRFICILMALFMLVCAVSCTKSGENGGATTAGGTTADVTTVPNDTILGDDTTTSDTTAADTAIEDTTAADPSKSFIGEALGYIEKKEYQAAYDLLKAHSDDEEARELFENFRFVPLLITGTDRGAGKREYTYDEDDMLISYSITMPEFSDVYDITYNDKKQVVKIDTAAEWSSDIEYFYDENDRVIKEVVKDYSFGDMVFEYFYNSDGYVEKIDDAHSDGTTGSTVYVYDDMGNMIKSTYTDSKNRCYITEIVYDENGNPIRNIETEDGIEIVFRFFYNDKGLLEKEVASLLNGTTYTLAEYFYDENGNLTKETHGGMDGIWASSEYSYDENGNVIKEIYSDIYGGASTTERTFDAYGNKLTETTVHTDGSTESYAYTYKLAYITYEMNQNVEILLMV